MVGRKKSPGTVSSQRQFQARAALIPITGFGAGLHNVTDEDHYDKPRLSVSELISTLIRAFRTINSEDYELHAVRTVDGRHLLHYIHKTLMASYHFNESVKAAWMVERDEIAALHWAVVHSALAPWCAVDNLLADNVHAVSGFNHRGAVKLGPAETVGIEFDYPEQRLKAFVWVPA